MCKPNPCQNGGTCKDVQGSYDCACTTGWTGENCQGKCLYIIKYHIFNESDISKIKVYFRSAPVFPGKQVPSFCHMFL